MEPNDEIARFGASTNVPQLGPAYSGRETIFSNGSLFIRKVSKNEGDYTFTVLDDDLTPDKVPVRFFVHGK